MSIAAGRRERERRKSGDRGAKKRERERGEERSEWDNTMRENARRALRDDTAGPLRERGDDGSGERGMWVEHGRKGGRWGGRREAQGEPVGLYVIDEAVIATGLHSTPRYCHQTMHIHRSYK